MRGEFLKTWLTDHKYQLLFLLVLVVVTYGFTANFDFISDDVPGIVNQDLTNLPLAFSNPFQLCKPIIYFVTNAIWGKIPWAYRLPNILSHLFVVYTLYLIIIRMVNERAAFISAALVAIHPIMIESVTWISGGGYSAYTLFSLLALLLFMERRRHPWLYWLSLTCFVIGLEFSEKAVVLAGILLAYVYLFESLKNKWQSLLPYVLLSGFWILEFAGLMGTRSTILANDFSQTNDHLNLFTRLIIAISSYLSLLVWPDKLTLYHTDFSMGTVAMFLRGAVVVGMVGLIAWLFVSSRRHHPWLKPVFFWAVVFVASISPTIASGSLAWVVAERYVYFGALALLVCLGILVDRWSRQPRQHDTAILAATILIILLAIRTLVRNYDWRDQDHLWLAAERTSPNSAQNNNNLGDLYERRHDSNKAIYYFTRATKLHSCYGDAYHNLANAYVQANQIDTAVANYRQAIQCKPQLWQSHQQLAVIYYFTGRTNEALAEIQAALTIAPDNQELLLQEQKMQTSPFQPGQQ